MQMNSWKSAYVSSTELAGGAQDFRLPFRCLQAAKVLLRPCVVDVGAVGDEHLHRRAYESVGYQVLGVIRNPVGCDVTAAFAGTATPTHCVGEL